MLVVSFISSLHANGNFFNVFMIFRL
jgi:hypothetical protein